MLCSRIVEHGDRKVCWFSFQQVSAHRGKNLCVVPDSHLLIHSFIISFFIFMLSLFISFVKQMLVETIRLKISVS